MQRRIFSLIAVAALALGLAACGSSSKNSPSSSPTTAAAGAPSGAAAGADTITIQNFKFSSITVKPGATVTVKNMDSTTHTNTADKGQWNTGDINSGSSATFTAPSTPGTYGFHCNIHNFMTGTLTVSS
jgi:plastocyanin